MTKPMDPIICGRCARTTKCPECDGDIIRRIEKLEASVKRIESGVLMALEKMGGTGRIIRNKMQKP